MGLLKRLSVVIILFVGISEAKASDIPTIYMTTPDSTAITSRDYWTENSTLRIVMPDGSVAYESTEVAIKARGNSTFTKPKKPFALKLKEKSGLLGMTPNKRWVLLANFMDHSFLRNTLALSIAKQTCLDWTPDSRMVDVVVNGQLQGCYQLCEQIRIGKDWIDIDKENGFLIEVDNYPNEKYRMDTKYRHLPVNVKSPEEPSLRQMASIEKYMNEIEHLLYSDIGSDLTLLYRDYIDMDTFADWWLVHELTQNAEPNGPRSCYMHKDKEGRLKAGPVWDFDLAFISVGLDKGGDIRPSRLNRTDVVLQTGDSIYNRRALWYDRLLQDKQFLTRVKERWHTLEPRFRALANDIDHWQALIEKSAMADEQLWKGQDPARFDTFPSFHSSVSNLKQVYLYRIESLNKLLAK